MSTNTDPFPWCGECGTWHAHGKHVTLDERNLGSAYDRIKELEDKLDSLQSAFDDRVRVIALQLDDKEKLRKELLYWQGLAGTKRYECADLHDRLDACRDRTIVRGALGALCEVCKGQWSYSRGGELHEDWCPNKPAVVERRDP